MRAMDVSLSFDRFEDQQTAFGRSAAMGRKTSGDHEACTPVLSWQGMGVATVACLCYVRNGASGE